MYFSVQLSPVANFVEVSKMQRELGKLEKAQAAIHKAAQTQIAARPNLGRSVRWGFLPLVYLIIAISFWGTPIAVLPSGWFSLLSAPLGMSDGLLGIFGWLLVVHFAVGTATCQFSQAIGLRAPASSSSTTDMLSSFISNMLLKS